MIWVSAMPYKDKEVERANLKQRKKRYHAKHRERLNAVSREYKDAHRDELRQKDREKKRQKRLENISAHRARARGYYVKHREASRDKLLRRNYGITAEQYEQMQDAQAGLCAICRKPESAKHQNGITRRLAVDHCHLTGRVRALLCSNCNHGIGHFKDTPGLMRRAAEYVELHRANPTED